MKRFCYLIYVFMLSGCIGESSKATSKLELNVDAVNFCDRTVGESFMWNDLQLRNTGKGPLTVKSIKLRGDEGCAFQCAYPSERGVTPCPKESAADGPSVSIADGSSMLIRLVFTPSAEDHTDQAAIVITADADNLGEDDAEWHQVIVPVCGNGVAVMDTDMDGGVTDAEDAGASTLDAGDLEGCGDCGEPLKKGAPSCTP